VNRQNPGIGRLVLSLFPGADLFSRPFEARGFCVVRGPEKLLGQDVRGWHAPAGQGELFAVDRRPDGWKEGS